MRLALYDQFPYSFQTYRVHDGRVTFYVAGEFELDLSVGQENQSSQFFFVDIRFLFFPSSPVPKGWVLNELDMKVNDVLRDKGLFGCFGFLHNLVLTNKIQALFKQAANLARGPWSDVLRAELLHRTLVVQYWASKPGPKSWIEIGIRSSCRAGGRGRSGEQGIPHLGLRWMLDGQEVSSGNVLFDTANLSMDCILRSVIALHICRILLSAYSKLSKSLLFSSAELSLQIQLSMSEPGNCGLNVQLTPSRELRVSVEPMSGACILSTTTNALERPESEHNSDKASDDEIVPRVSRLRCMAAIEEIESNMKMLGFETINPRGLRLDVRKIFPPNILRFSLFWHHLWGRNWILAATSSMDSDNWWLVQFREALQSRPDSRTGFKVDAGASLSPIIRSQVISGTFQPARQPLNYASFADLGHCLTGMLAVYANACYLADIQSIAFYPSLQRLQIESSLQVPDMFIRYEPPSLPSALRLALPAGLKGNSFMKETIRLTFYGIDAQTGAAIMVAYGNLRVPTKTLDTLIPKCHDQSLTFQRTGGGFALRLFSPPGHSVIIDLIMTLQRLECVLSIAESIQQKKMAIESFSLSQVVFSYSPETGLSAAVHIKYFSASHKESVDPAGLAWRTKPLFHARLSISFDHRAPHRRIQKSLTAILNNESGDAGFDSAVEMLSLTHPLLRALDRITANPSLKGQLKTQVTVRNATSFQIRYPTHRSRFQLTTGQYLDRMTWILKDMSGVQDYANYTQIAARLQNGLYNSKGDGWRGLGNGVAAEVDKIENLLSALDRCFEAVPGAPAAAVVGDQEKSGKSHDKMQAATTKDSQSGTGADPHGLDAPTTGGSRREPGVSSGVETISIE